MRCSRIGRGVRWAQGDDGGDGQFPWIVNGTPRADVIAVTGGVHQLNGLGGDDFRVPTQAVRRSSAVTATTT